MNDWLALVFLGLMALAMLIYVVLDGYDLGVGILLQRADEGQKDMMIASIGPFWDANETWLVLGVGILLVAFPTAHGEILGGLYLPVTFMLFGLILRGVAFDFRVKARSHHKPMWNAVFHGGSLLATFSQGFMLGIYILGFEYTVSHILFAVFIGLSLSAGYALLGASWLLLKTEGELFQRATYWAYRSLWLTGLGIAAVSLATPLISERIYLKWFALPELLWLAPIPLLTLFLFLVCERKLRALQSGRQGSVWIPFTCTVSLFVLAFVGLAYSLFPYLVPDTLRYDEAASAPESLKIMLVGVAITLPAILFYTAYSYSVFWGKATELHYD